MSDFRILNLNGYDIILGADWVHQHSPITLDYKKMTLQITKEDGTTILFHDDSLPNNPSMQQTEWTNYSTIPSVAHCSSSNQ
jgi:hypothetical protein